jgi:integrase/recombinase XerD
MVLLVTSFTPREATQRWSASIITANPFRWKPLKYETHTRKSLTLNEVITLAELDIEKNSKEYHARNAFIFSTLHKGMRFRNVMLLKKKDYNSINRSMEYYSIKDKQWCNDYVNPELHDMLVHYQSLNPECEYLFPLLTNEDYTIEQQTPDTNKFKPEFNNRLAVENKHINRRLKKIAKQAKIKTNISFHIARHTFVTLGKALYSMDIVSKTIGHSSEKVTNLYATPDTTPQPYLNITLKEKAH